MSKIHVDIVIPQYKNIVLLERCLKSLASIDIPESITKIWVIENGGDFGAKNIVAMFEGVLPVGYAYLNEGNLSKARNKGIELSTADAIIFFDNDMTFYSDTITSYIEIIEKNGDDYFYGGALLPNYEITPEPWLNEFLPRSAKGFSINSQVVKYNKPHFLGGNHAVFRKHLIKLGGYDLSCATGDNEGAMGEETRLQQKLLDLGIMGIFIPKACVKHYVPKENCSKKWILKRAERFGITDAFQDKNNSYKTFLGVPLFHYRILINHLTKLTLFFWNKEAKFRSLYGIRYQIGLITQFFKYYINK